MLLKEIYKALLEFYPVGISGFSVEYYNTSETIKKNKLKSKDSSMWTNFFKALKENFPNKIIEDRTDDSVSNIALLYFHENNETVQIVLHISMLLPYYCYYSNYYDQMKFQKAYKEKWNFIIPEYQFVKNVIEELVFEYYPNYKIMPPEILDEIVYDLSTPGFELGSATFFNLVFTDHNFP